VIFDTNALLLITSRSRSQMRGLNTPWVGCPAQASKWPTLESNDVTLHRPWNSSTSSFISFTKDSMWLVLEHNTNEG
jgi:hypothetical protein